MKDLPEQPVLVIEWRNGTSRGDELGPGSLYSRTKDVMFIWFWLNRAVGFSRPLLLLDPPVGRPLLLDIREIGQLGDIREMGQLWHPCPWTAGSADSCGSLGEVGRQGQLGKVSGPAGRARAAWSHCSCHHA